VGGNIRIEEGAKAGGNNFFEGFAKSGSETNGAIVGRVGVVLVGLGDHNDEGLFPGLGDITVF